MKIPDQYNNLVLVRHLEDEPYISDTRDSHILDSEKHKASSIIMDISRILEEQSYANVQLYTSPLLRSLETSEIVSAGLQELSIQVMTHSDNALSSMGHGRLSGEITLPEERRITEKIAKRIYMVETFDNSNPYYRYGDPITDSNGVPKYPELIGKFEEFGECQIEMSFRIYKFMIGLVEREVELENSLIVLVTHTVFIIRTMSFPHLVNHRSPLWYLIPSGEVYKLEQEMLEKVLGDFDYGAFFSKELPIYYLDINSIKTIYDLLVNELAVIRASYLQRFNVTLI